MKEYCFNYTESWFPLAGMENSFKNTFLLDGKAGISNKSKKMVVNSSNRGFK